MSQRLVFIILTLLLLIMTFSCTTAKKATRYMHEHPQVAAEFCADEFPVKTVTDSAAYKKSLDVIDSLIKVQEAEKEITQAEREVMINDIERLKAMPDPDCDSVSDAVYRYAAKEKKRADNLESSNLSLQRAAKNVKPIRDTVENTARVKASELQLQAVNNKLEKVAGERDELKDFRNSMRGKVHIPIWILIVAGVALAGWIYWRIKAGALNKVLAKFKK